MGSWERAALQVVCRGADEGAIRSLAGNQAQVFENGVNLSVYISVASGIKHGEFATRTSPVTVPTAYGT